MMAEFQADQVESEVAMHGQDMPVNCDNSGSSECLGNGKTSSFESLFSSTEDLGPIFSENPTKSSSASSFEAAGDTCSRIYGDELNGLRVPELQDDFDDFDDFEDETWWPSPPDLRAEHFSVASEVLQTAYSAALENSDIISQRNTRERSSELNELQNTARPVTGTNARQNLLQFFSRAIDPTSFPNQNAESQPPEDIQNLIQRSIVSSALRRHEFRAALEQSLSSRLTPLAAAGNNTVPRVAQGAARSASGISTPLLPAQDIDTASIISDATTNELSDAASDFEQLQRVLDAGVQVLSETIEEDIVQLRHLHVVSSVLGGGFRNNLERLFQERAQSVGGGELVERFIRSLPRSNPSVQRGVSQRGSSSRPSTGSQRVNLAAEVNTLKTQMDEMKRMLQTTLEVQMETQRSIRQEISAVFGAFMDQMSQASGNVPAHQSRIPDRNPVPASAGSCVICLDRQVDTVLYQCGHMCVCITCGLHLKVEGHHCPMCRAPIRDVIRAYKSH